MRNILGLLVLFVAGFWLYGRCTGSDNSHSNEVQIIKQVRVVTAIANLRTGPGTNYAIETVNADGTGGKWQLKGGSIVNVVKEQNGWYQVCIGDDKRTAYIKKTLCTELNDCSAPRRVKNSNSRSSSTSSENSATSGTLTTPTATPVSPNEEDVVEITTGHVSEDEVFY